MVSLLVLLVFISSMNTGYFKSIFMIDIALPLTPILVLVFRSKPTCIVIVVEIAVCQCQFC